MHPIFTQEQVCEILASHGLELLDKYINSKTKMKLKNSDGYIVYSNINAINSNKMPRPFDKCNPFTIDNINLYLQRRFSGRYRCISLEYKGNREPLSFICTKCNTQFETKWVNVCRKGENRNGLICPHCGARNESLHALVLKQIFLHEYPDTIVEETSCINPLTNKVLPTDIVNHKLKIAIEIQSGRHDLQSSRIKDKIKKDFWISKGYNFYDPDIRDYSILEMIQIFFENIKEIPEYVNYEYENKINVKKVQQLLDGGLSISEIARQINVAPHILYDSVYSGKLKYPLNYTRGDLQKVVKIDLYGNFVCVYNSLQEAYVKNELYQGAIADAWYRGRLYTHGYFWVRYQDYISGNYILDEKFKKINMQESVETAG